MGQIRLEQPEEGSGFILSLLGELKEGAIQGSDMKVRRQERKWGS